MNISGPFLKRPVMTILVMISVAFFGVLAYQALPVSDLPDVAYPTIEVSVDYPGADPQTIANNVVVPLEKEFTTIQGIQTIASTSYTGSATIVLQFNLDRNVDLAAPDVQAAINAAQPQLPQDLPYAPTYSKVNPTSTPVLFFAITSQTMTFGDLYNYGDVVIGERLSIIDGVSQVQTYGQPYAVRLRIDPQKLASRGIGIDEVGTAIQNANVYLPVGTLFGETREFTIDVNGQLESAAEYDRVIIKNDNGSITRFRDIGKALDSVQDDKMYFAYSDKQDTVAMVGLALRTQAGANTLQVIERVNAILPQLLDEIPGSVKLIRMYDQSDYIWESVHDVEFTLVIALLLVILVIFFYLGTVRDTVIPVLAIPMSILGTFIVMLYAGFTIDILSLLAITLAIGFLVDDAIVVLENIVRHVEHGESPFQAAINGSKEIGFTILSMTLCLCTVFIPLIFMAGIIGRILHEFAVTIVTAVAISGIISLTLTPLLCSRFIPPHIEGRQKNRVERFSEAFNQKILDIYGPSLEWALNHRITILAVGLASVLFSVFLLVTLPKDFMPPDDLGLVEGYVQTVDGTSPFLIGDYMQQLAKIAVNDPNVLDVAAVGGYPQDNEGVLYINLKPLSERLSLIPLLHEMNQKMNSIPGVQVFLKPLPLINLQVGAVDSKAAYQYTIQGLNPQDIFKYGPILEEKFNALKTIKNVVSDLDITQPQLQIEILRDRASTYGISAYQIENTLNLAYATSNLSPINMPNNQYYAIMETFPKFYYNPAQLQQIWLRSSLTGELVPLSAITTMKEGLGPLTVNHVNGLPSATISFNLAPGAALSEALKEVEAVAKQTLPTAVFGSIQGAADVFKTSFANLQFLLIITIFIIYVILGILYESFFPPITVMSTLPPAAMGGLFSLMIFGQTLSLFAFVGLIMLLGIVLKNGIIMIDFANASRAHEGKNIHDAIYHACMVRVRPILMTTFAALMGAVPIALGIGGATAKSRMPLGIVIVGGLIVSQILTLYLTPVIYIYVEKFHDKIKLMKAEKEAKISSQQMKPPESNGF
ncbi:MAG: efflux RND transporter permease subunit [Rhabdochlamydiaceae bacterium]|nr:efflux RND transporter permease subunit [Rhabdochlamydiaceae bacterium]